MLIGSMGASDADRSQALDPRRDALIEAGTDSSRLYAHHAPGKRDDRPGRDPWHSIDSAGERIKRCAGLRARAQAPPSS